jgi:hypothetical protein
MTTEISKCVFGTTFATAVLYKLTAIILGYRSDSSADKIVLFLPRIGNLGGTIMKAFLNLF